MFSQTKADLAETEAELTDTRTDLSNTRTTLEKTRHHLQATTQDRDEQQHLVRQQVQTEGKLTSQASQVTPVPKKADFKNTILYQVNSLCQIGMKTTRNVLQYSVILTARQCFNTLLRTRSHVL